MGARKLAAATAAALVVAVSLGYLWHEVVMVDLYVGGLGEWSQPVPSVPWVLAAHLVLAALMAWIYPIGYRGGVPLLEGLRFGALIGVLWSLPLQLLFHGAFGEPLRMVLLDSLWHLVEEGAAGAAVGLVYGRS